MEFKKFSAGTENYGLDEKPKVEQLSNVSFSDPDFVKKICSIQNKEDSSGEKDYLHLMMLSLAVCHTIIIDEKKGTYNAASPDDLALVNFAKQFGFEFMGKDINDNVLINEFHIDPVTQAKKGLRREHRFQLLHVCEFNSTRKRMSVVMKKSTGEIMLYCKGADSVITEFLHAESLNSEIKKKSDDYVTEYALIGLRTLFVACKEVSQEFYDQWKIQVDNAKNLIEGRDEEVERVDGLIETEMELVGSTAIEDRLQDKVADTIQFMKSTGIKVWVLTGDKIETAKNIGFSAGLLDNDMQIFEIRSDLEDKKNQDALMNELQQAQNGIQSLKNSGTKTAIVVAGRSLIDIDGNEKIREIFLSASDNSDVVLACRVSPKQKADIVNMIRDRFPGKVTLSIGDGANDVNMILQAHVGVGILGKEGQQAARSADYAIGQFKFLKPLMFIHGREAYRRNSLLVKYIFYKNVIYVVAQYYFGMWSEFSSQVLYEPLIYQAWNVTMTSLPIIFYALFDFEYEKGTDQDEDQPNSTGDDGVQIINTNPQPQFMKNPLLYRIGMDRSCYTMIQYTSWIILGLVHGFMVFIICFYCVCYPGELQMAGGKDLGFWVAGHVVYGGCAFVCNFLILIRYNNFTGYGEALVALMLIAYFLIFYIENKMSMLPQIYGIFNETFSNFSVWLMLLLVSMIVTIGEIGFKAANKLGYIQKLIDQIFCVRSDRVKPVDFRSGPAGRLAQLDLPTTNGKLGLINIDVELK